MKYSPSISIIVPVLNEEENIVALITRLTKTLLTITNKFEIIFIDDHSTDNTFSILSQIASEYKHIRVFKKEGKEGKAFSLVEGFTKAKYEVLGMIDADLQYPPEALSKMTTLLAKSDVVVANRLAYQDSPIRKILSRTNRFVFGKLLFGLEIDVQSGLKLFKRKVLPFVPQTLYSPWTFDLEFLHLTKQAGFSISHIDITFEERKKGVSKINIFQQPIEIGLNALLVWAKDVKPYYFPGKNVKSMRGAGVGFKAKKFITHSTLPYHKSAIETFHAPQLIGIFFFIIAFINGLIYFPFITLLGSISLLSIIYFLDSVFYFFIILKSLDKPIEISFSNEELAQLNNSNLPIYSILCPLYKEAHILPGFLSSIEQLDYPKDKLDVLLLLEEDDKETIKASKQLNLPSYVRVIVVPNSQPKTKPKACNYGITLAKGEYIVIYDAEDIPDPLQLKKAFLGFRTLPKNIFCLQAKLNYFNKSQNLLTRFFTAEYSLWFDVVLPGLQSLETALPLGGTSNHFRTKNLLDLQGWDPFNVAEDADLGIRLFKQGYKTAIIDSTTLEEANSQVGNWIRQRSRWIKGYMQTYVVHSRKLGQNMMKDPKHEGIFHLIMGGKLAFIFINPILWLATISYFALYKFVGPTIESLYPSLIFYMAAFSLVFGNFLFIYTYMVGCVKRNHWDLMKFVYLIPLYWLIISYAGFIAFWQLLFKPHYWEKTTHGLHIKKENKKYAWKLPQQLQPSYVRYLLNSIL